MKRSISWPLIFGLLVGAGCVACLSYLSRKCVMRSKAEDKLDEALDESFPASDPLPY